MTAFYQIPCPSCGKVHEVQKTEAGCTLSCSCGQPMDVPPLRQLEQFPFIERKAPAVGDEELQLTTSSEGGIRQKRVGMLLLLMVLALIFAGLSVRFYVDRPQMPKVSDMNMYTSWFLWQRLRPGIEPPLGRQDTLFLNDIAVAWRWIVLMASLSGVCLLSAFALLLAPVKKGPTR